MALEDLTAAAVRRAMAECDRLGREKFLAKYGFGKARTYQIIGEAGRLYDSKAIAGVAHGFLTGEQPMRFNKFSGGVGIVVPVLESLGFTISHPVKKIRAKLFPGDVLNNQDLMGALDVGISGGMRRSRRRNHLVLISDPSKGVYQDRWDADVLHYTGMGKRGPQRIKSTQNRTLAESKTTGIKLHLFECKRAREYTYVGEAILAGPPYEGTQPDVDGNIRTVWIFPLKLQPGAIKPLLTEDQASAVAAAQERVASELPLAELERRAKGAMGQPPKRDTITTSFARNPFVVAYVKRLAKGICDLCDEGAPFQNKKKSPYLECHHVKRLADGGEDTIGNAVALCPKCNRKMHVLDRAADRRKLLERAKSRVGGKAGRAG